MKFTYFPLNRYFHIILIASAIIDDINKLSESPLAFVRYANNTIDNQRSNNETLQDVLLAIETIDDKDLLINKILSREILK